MTLVEEKYEYTTVEQSILDKDWAAGSTKQINMNEFIISKNNGTYIGTYKSIKYAPAWMKIIDEPIVNALDHMIRCIGTDNPVTVIKVGIDRSGRIRIYNDGAGIEIVIHKIASEKLGREIYVPTFLFGVLFQGSNRKRADDCIIGGTNGLGAKLSVVFSKDFILETVDKNNYFIQRWHDHKAVEDKPKIINLNSEHKLPKDRINQHTTLSFLPDYSGIFGYTDITDEIYNDLCDLIRTRMFFATAYAQYAVRGKQAIELWFNEEKIPVKNINDIATIMFPDCTQITSIITPVIDPKSKARAAFRYKWELCAVVVESAKYDYPQLSNVNGILVRDGKHIKYILNNLVGGVKEKISKILHDKNLKFAPSHVTTNLFLFINSQIPNPSWTGQRKDILDMDIRKFSGYNLDAAFINTTTDKLRNRIITNIFVDMPQTAEKKKNKPEYEKYHPANEAGSKTSSACSLILVEGDSAMRRVETGISNSIGWNHYGIMSTGGVIINARKECIILNDRSDKRIKKTTKLINNIFINAMMNITGLNPTYKYDKNSLTYKKEISELNYGCLIACVDQDLDGKGNILGLLLNIFELFFPNLLRGGYIKWYCSPIIRAYPKKGGKVISFYSMIEYKKWEEINNVQDYDVRYYKGIGTHSREEIIHMFEVFSSQLYTYYLDDRSNNLFDIYFGTNSDDRKKELSGPAKYITDEKMLEQLMSKLISCSDHLEYETRPFQKDNLYRKLDHISDGLNKAGRKILDGFLKALVNKRTLRVDQLAGFVAEYENYHHGIASIESSIIGKGLITVGGKQIPLIIPLSNFGSRKEGGNDASSARYINAKLNKNITDVLYPVEDYWILPFNFDEGERSEPKWFAPILPMAILESVELPSHGWKLKLWARDVFKVIENVKRLIMLGDNVQLLKLPPCTYKGSSYEWTGEFKTIRGELYSFGKYNYDITTNSIRITELPLRTWTVPYLEMLEKKRSTDPRIIAKTTESADDLHIDICVNLKPDAMSILESSGDSIFTDGIEEYFQLRNRMDSHINLIGYDDEVISFTNYEDVIYPWFKVRKAYYIQRMERRQILINLQIKYLENVIRYIEQSIKMNLPTRKYDEMIKLLTEQKYDRIHKGKLLNPKFTPTSELNNVILFGPKANYDYLLDLSDRNKSEESLDIRQKELIKYKLELSSVIQIASSGQFPGAVLWIAELNKLEKLISDGQKTFWLFEDAGKFTY